MRGTIDEVDTAAGVLAAVRRERHSEVVAQARQLELAVSWAAMHSTDSILDAATWGDTPVTIAGPGAPLVAEFCCAELAAALGLPTETGKALLGEAVELAHRLPRLWARVQAHELPAWRARRVARATMVLSPQAASFVDRHVAAVAHRVGPVVLDRLVQEAVARFMPVEANTEAEAAMDRRHVTVDHRQVSMTGTSRVTAEVDLADALDLEQALARRAEHRKQLGSAESLDARRAAALGDLARRELALDLVPGEETHQPRQPVTLYLHLSDRAVTDQAALGGVGRVENTGTPITAEQIRTWCGSPFADVVVKPVLDLDQHVHVAAYEVPDRLKEQAILVDQTCVHPYCSRPARRCDQDHCVAHSAGGNTCTGNLAPLCRRHHRLKTHHGGWTYTVIDQGTYLWTSPHGYQFLRDRTGTTDVSRDRAGPP